MQITNKKPVLFVLLTFLITWFGWLFPLYQAETGNYSGIWVVDNMPFRIAGYAPMIVGLVLMYKELFKKDFLIKFLFGVPKKLFYYIIVILMFALSLSIYIIFGDLSNAASIKIFLSVLLTQCVFGGGFEEFGWRGYLQPVLEQKYKTVIPIVIAIGIIWSLWHLPLWIINGSYQEGTNFIPYMINTIIVSFSLAAILKLTNSVILCIVFHGWNNAIFMCIPITMSIPFYILRILEGLIAVIICIYISRKEDKK